MCVCVCVGGTSEIASLESVKSQGIPVIPLIRSPIRVLTGRSSPSAPGAFSISLQRADFAQPGIPVS